MEYKIRNCSLKFYLEYGGFEGSQTCNFRINRKNYTWWLSNACGDLFGYLVEILYGLCYEMHVNDVNDEIKYEYNDPQNKNKFTAISGKTIWDSEGDSIEWHFRRDLEKNAKLVDITIKHYEEVLEVAQINLADACYAVTRALTDYLKRTGICGHHYSSDGDSINIFHFLMLKKYALTGKMDYAWEERNKADLSSSFKEEIELLSLDM